MTFKEVYSRVIELWSETIDFSDGAFFDLKTQKSVIPGYAFVGPDFGSNLLFQQWEKIDEIIGREDPYGNLMAWTLHWEFHEHARELVPQTIFSLNPKQISKQEIEEQFFRGLHEPGMEKELAGYERIID